MNCRGNDNVIKGYYNKHMHIYEHEAIYCRSENKYTLKQLTILTILRLIFCSSFVESVTGDSKVQVQVST